MANKHGNGRMFENNNALITLRGPIEGLRHVNVECPSSPTGERNGSDDSSWTRGTSNCSDTENLSPVSGLSPPESPSRTSGEIHDVSTGITNPFLSTVPMISNFFSSLTDNHYLSHGRLLSSSIPTRLPGAMNQSSDSAISVSTLEVSAMSLLDHSGHESEFPNCNTQEHSGRESPRSLSNSLDIEVRENHFNQPRFAHSKKDELLSAIETCKRMANQHKDDEDMKDKYVRQLVALRLKLLEEAEEEVLERSCKKINFHKFILREKRRHVSKTVCEHCSSLLLGIVHKWYQCMHCEFRVHERCVELVARPCPYLLVMNGSADFKWTICPTVGLAAQKFRCAECKRRVSLGAAPPQVSDDSRSPVELPLEARLCDYSGLYYCSKCHWNDSYIIPARVINNWDFTPRKVSRPHRALLKMLKRKPIIDISALNSSLYNHIEELSRMDQLRKAILLMKEYLVHCENAKKERLLLLLKDRQHFVENSHMYSMQDLIDIGSGLLDKSVSSIHDIFKDHIQSKCSPCSAKGFICEVCRQEPVIFPFDLGVSVCSQCSATYHRDCFPNPDSSVCVRCQRRRSRRLTDPPTTP